MYILPASSVKHYRIPAVITLLVLLAVKIILEQMDLTLSLVNLGSSQVVVDAHLYGAVVGLLFGIVLQIKQNYDV